MQPSPLLHKVQGILMTASALHLPPLLAEPYHLPVHHHQVHLAVVPLLAGEAAGAAEVAAAEVAGNTIIKPT